MILLLDASTPICKLTLIDGEKRLDDEWQADRELAKGLLGYIQKQLQKNNASWTDISGIGVFRGPGSFTGLRIGLTVTNTIAAAQSIPIVGAVGEAWQKEVMEMLNNGKDDKIVLPFYGSEARITKPRK